MVVTDIRVHGAGPPYRALATIRKTTAAFEVRLGLWHAAGLRRRTNRSGGRASTIKRAEGHRIPAPVRVAAANGLGRYWEWVADARVVDALVSRQRARPELHLFHALVQGGAAHLALEEVAPRRLAIACPHVARGVADMRIGGCIDTYGMTRLHEFTPLCGAHNWHVSALPLINWHV